MNIDNFFRRAGYAMACIAIALAPWIGLESLHAQGRNDALLTSARAEQIAVVATLKRLVEIDSGSGDSAGLARLADLLDAELKALGFTVERVAAPPGPGVSIVGRIRGSGQQKILMMAHMDTVYPPGTVAKKPFRVAGPLAYGPGIADDKGGIAIILHSLKLLLAGGLRNFGELVVMFNPDEERGSVGSSGLIEKLASEVDHVLSYEPTSADVEAMVLATSGIASVGVTVTGKAAHAGAAPELGVNALIELADLMLRTVDLDAPAKGVRFNWTTASGGEVRNMIPDKAAVSADVRYLRNEDFDATMVELKQRLERKRLSGAQVALSIVPGRPAFQAGEGGRRLIEKARAIYQELGLDIRVVPSTGGGTDAAYAVKSGKPVIESMGLPGANYHSNADEYVRIDRIAERLYLSVRMIDELAAGK